ncbi:VOC family protein [Stackebrandtia soli]|uniref:VOC family protein n=1 Tax=Stackebrandtia soli TaxID=1892856 RepID=UPI0039EB7063
MASRWYSTVVDARDPRRLAHWWAEVLGFRVVYETIGETAIRGDGHPGLVFVPVAADKIVKNRLHLDLEPDDQDAEVERLVDMGARHVDVGQKRVPWVVLADPEGNEFCVLAARER